MTEVERSLSTPLIGRERQLDPTVRAITGRARR